VGLGKRGIRCFLDGIVEMSLRRAYAAALQLLRSKLDLRQKEIAGKVTQSHISQLETYKTSATVDVTHQLATALNVETLSFMALVMAAEKQITPREAWTSSIAELSQLGIADSVPPAQPVNLTDPRVVASGEKREQIQKLKAMGYSQIRVVKELGYSRATVWRLWESNDA
jgi:transcriptional regulator with XRE-family HTH domain